MVFRHASYTKQILLVSPGITFVQKAFEKAYFPEAYFQRGLLTEFCASNEMGWAQQ